MPRCAVPAQLAYWLAYNACYQREAADMHQPDIHTLSMLIVPPVTSCTEFDVYVSPSIEPLQIGATPWRRVVIKFMSLDQADCCQVFRIAGDSPCDESPQPALPTSQLSQLQLLMQSSCNVSGELESEQQAITEVDLALQSVSCRLLLWFTTLVQAHTQQEEGCVITPHPGCSQHARTLICAE